MEYLGVVLLLAWAVNVWVFLGLIEARPGLVRLIIWGAVLLVPVIGLIVYLALGRKGGRS